MTQIKRTFASERLSVKRRILIDSATGRVGRKITIGNQRMYAAEAITMERF